MFFAFCVNKDSDETFDRVEEEKNRELLKRRTEALSLSVGISCQNCGAFGPLQDELRERADPDGREGGRGKRDLQTPWLIPCFSLEEGFGREGGTRR